MPAAVTNKFRKATSGTRPSPTTLSSLKLVGASSISCQALTGWPTDTAVDFIIYNVDTANKKIAGTQTDWIGVVSGTTITNLTLKAGTDSGYSVGAVVEAGPTAAWATDLVSGLTTSINQDGSLITSAVQTALNLGSSSLNGWNPLGYTFTYAANNGNKEYTVTTPSDLTSTLSAGMKFQTTRGTVAPTQSMAFTAASSQYASKASPTGITFTNTWTQEAWIYLNSYTGVTMDILGRLDTNGFQFSLTPGGQLDLRGRAANVDRSITSYQSVPLKRWVHVAASFTMSTGVGAIYINGVLVPSIATGSLTALVQSSAALILGQDQTARYFDGYMSEARLWSNIQTQAQIQANMNISLTGSESSLIGLWQGNGNFNDKTANANNLTASGGAVATQAANPYNTVEYGIITKVSYSAPNTTLTIFTGTDYNIPNMTLSTPYYSTARTPQNFPAGQDKWAVYTFVYTSYSPTVSASINTWYNAQTQLAVPTGSWLLTYEGNIQVSTGSGTGADIYSTLSTSTSASTDTEFASRDFGGYGGVTSSNRIINVSRSLPRLLAAQTTYSLLLATSIASTTSLTVRGSASLFVPEVFYIKAVSAYL